MAMANMDMRELSSLNADIFVVLRRTNRALTHLYNLVLSPTGLKATQVAILLAIQQSGEIAQWRLADEFGISDESLSRRLATLRAAGLVMHRISTNGHRERLYRLTAAGVEKCEEVLPYWRRAEDRLRSTLGVEEWQFLNLISELGVKARAAESMRCSNSEPLTRQVSDLEKPADTALS